jgi:hypothetical protein
VHLLVVLAACNLVVVVLHQPQDLVRRAMAQS